MIGLVRVTVHTGAGADKQNHPLQDYPQMPLLCLSDNSHIMPCMVLSICYSALSLTSKIPQIFLTTNEL